GEYSIRLYFNPLERIIWIGALIMFAGGAVSLSDRRLRLGAPRRSRRLAMAPAERVLVIPHHGGCQIYGPGLLSSRGLSDRQRPADQRCSGRGARRNP